MLPSILLKIHVKISGSLTTEGGSAAAANAAATARLRCLVATPLASDGVCPA